MNLFLWVSHQQLVRDSVFSCSFKISQDVTKLWRLKSCGHHWDYRHSNTLQQQLPNAGCLTLWKFTGITFFSWKSSGNLQNLLEIFWLSSCVCCYYDCQYLYFKMYR